MMISIVPTKFCVCWFNLTMEISPLDLIINELGLVTIGTSLDMIYI